MVRCRVTILPFLAAVILLAVSFMLVNATDGQSVGAVLADAQEASTPTSGPTTTVVTPMAVTVLPSESTVTPLEGEAEASTAPLNESPAGRQNPSNPFLGVRGGFIGAGIGIGLVVVATAAVRGVRAVAKRRHG